MMFNTLPPIATTLDPSWHPRLEMLSQLSNMVAICRKEKICYINPAGVKLLGFASPKEALGVSVSSFFHSDYIDVVELGLEVLAEDETLYCKLVHEDKSEFDVEAKVTSLPGFELNIFMLEIVDISEHIHSAQAVRLREQRLQGILNTVADGIITVDDKGEIQTFNPSAEKIFNLTITDVLGENIRILLPPDYSEDLTSGYGPAWAKSISEDSDLIGIRNDGQTFPMEMSIRELYQNETLSFIAIVRDITQRKNAEKEMTLLAHFDQLTGLASRSLLTDRFLEASKTAKRNKKQLVLLFLDLNKFKPINDTLGHGVGDEVLKMTAERLNSCVRETDTVARVGGDEFVILLRINEIPKDYTIVAENIIKSMAEPFHIGEHTCTTGASIGISVQNQHGEDLETLIECADTAMYEAKRKGGGTYSIYAASDSENK